MILRLGLILVQTQQASPGRVMAQIQAVAAQGPYRQNQERGPVPSPDPSGGAELRAKCGC